MAVDQGKPAHSRDTLHDADGGITAPHSAATMDGSALIEEAMSKPESFDDEALDAFGDIRRGSHVGGRYLIEGVIGKGATGVVFDASHLLIGKHVALKCLYPHHSAAPNAVQRFFREAKIAATVEHPNVIQVFDGGKDGDVMFLAMERLTGESLGDRLERGAMPVQEAIELFLGIMDGVAAVHERGVVHRDLKPDNIFIVPAGPGTIGGPKVLDFGISKLKEPGMRELTTLGTVMGTPFYMAPEQVTNTRDVDARADVYSLGVMLYEALVGDVPYPEETVLDIFTRSQAGDATPLERLRGDVPEPVARLVEKAMRPDRDQRFASVAEMRDALAVIRPPDTNPGGGVSRGNEHLLTMRDFRSPVANVPIHSDDVATPHRSEHALNVKGLPIMDRRTVPMMTKPLTEVPRWMWYVLGGAAFVTFISLILAVMAFLA